MEGWWEGGRNKNTQRNSTTPTPAVICYIQRAFQDKNLAHFSSCCKSVLSTIGNPVCVELDTLVLMWCTSPFKHEMWWLGLHQFLNKAKFRGKIMSCFLWKKNMGTVSYMLPMGKLSFYLIQCDILEHQCQKKL